jgi:hypothetical protein
MFPESVQTAFGIVAAVWIAAYSPTETRHYTLIVDESFPEADRAVIQASAAAWRRALPELTLDVVLGPPCDPTPSDAPAPVLAPGRPICVRLITDLSDLPENTLAYTTMSPQGAVVYLPAGTIQDTTAHELGHGMGLRHSKECGTLMFPYRYRYGQRCDNSVPTKTDVEAWRAVAR